MQWIQRIQRNGFQLEPVYVDEHGLESVGALGNWRSGLERRSTVRATHINNFDLRDLRTVAATEYTIALGLPNACPTGHEVYETYVDGKRALIPAVVLTSSLVGWMRGLGDWLLRPGSLDQLAAPVFDDDGRATVLLNRKTRITGNASDETLQERFLWLTTFPSGRHLWASVYIKANQGRLGVNLPAVCVDATLNGRVVGRTLYVYRMSIKTLRPLDAPLPFAAHLVGATFRFDRHRTRGQAMLAYLANAEVHPNVTTEPELLKGPAGWSMTPSEWQMVLAKLKAAGFKTPRTAGPTISLALEKYGAGKAWTELGDKGGCVKATVSQWRKRGKWAVVLETLNALRKPRSALQV